MLLWNWVGLRYAFCKFVQNQESAKRQCSVILTSGTKLLRAAGKSSAALLNSCSLLPLPCCRVLLRWLAVHRADGSLLLTRSRAVTLHMKNTKHHTKLKEKFGRHLLIFLIFFNNASKHLEVWSYVMKHVALSWNYLQTAGSAGKRDGSHCALKAVPLKPCLVSTSALLKLA